MKRNCHTLRALACFILITMLILPLLCACVPSERSVTSAAVNKDGELILYYSDGSSENVGRVKGEDGEDGAPGLRGETGKKGNDGADGEKGDPGQDGKDGKDGQNGRDGTDGIITVVPDSDTVALASAKGLRSAVSIYCTFSNGSAAGSGVIWQMDPSTGDALIITNHHVVYKANSNTTDGISNNITVFLYGSEYDTFGIQAEYVGGSMNYDIAVLSVTGSERLRQSDAVPVTVADSETVRVGSEAIAVGNPKALGISATFGIVSVDSEYLKMLGADGETEIVFRVMRIDTAVNSGNSGGGLYNSAGELIGIVNAKIADDDVENIGYAIPSNLAVTVAQNIVDHCLGTNVRTVVRAMLGVSAGIVDSHSEFDASSGYIKTVEKVAIGEVLTSGAAYGLLQTDDVLLSATLGEKTVAITRAYHVVDLMLEARAGDTISFRILRGGEEKSVNVTISNDDLVAY